MHSNTGLGEAAAWLWAGGAGIVGRAMYHVHLLQQGKAKPLWWVVCDIMIALGMGWIVLGLGQWLNVGHNTIQSLAIMAGWGGPQLIDRAIQAGVDRVSKGSDAAEKP